MSNIEERFNDFKFQKLLKMELKDSNDFLFTAKPDIAFIDTYTGMTWFAELKEHELNSIKTVETSRKNLCRQASFRGLFVSPMMSHSQLSGLLWNAGYRQVCLDNAWNHSKYKQGIISKALQRHDRMYAVIFSQHHPTIGKGIQEKAFKIDYQKKAGINQIWLESEFWSKFEEGQFRVLSSEEIAMV